MVRQPLISICIPTNNRVDIVRETIKSLLAQPADANLYEICISDNSKTDETKGLLKMSFRWYRIYVMGNLIVLVFSILLKRLSWVGVSC